MGPCRTMLALVAMALCRIKMAASNESSNLTTQTPTAAASSCGGNHTETEFSLRSPGFPVQYPAKVKCDWRVFRRSESVCGLEFTFQTFDLEPSDNCTYDYFQVDQTKLCGKINDGSVRVFMFAENETSLRFVSDNQNSRSGFDIRARQITTCSPDAAPGFSCSRTYDQKEFFIRSPDYPGNYSHDANCTYRVLRHSKRVCAIKVTFATFHLEESVNCKNDYFSVDDRKFCGSLEDATTQTFPFQTNEKILSFYSDSSVSGSGFFAHVQQEECDPRSLASPQDECSTEIKTAEFELKSPGYPTDAYADDLNCRYRVMKSSPLVCELMITILDFKLQEGEVCENDYLQIAEERLCGTIESGMTRMYSFGDLDEILMNFDTDGSVGDKGFHISGFQRECNFSLNATEKGRKAQNAWDCDRTIMGSEDSIRSPGFPDVYPPNVDCRWMVLRADPRYCELEITINNLHIQVGESCQFDYLEVDGHRFCGSTTAGNKRIFSFKTEQIVIHFHSDGSVNDRGFEVTLKQRDCPTTTTTTLAPAASCDQVFDSKHFILVSPNHPRDYDNGVDCRYVIRRSSEDVCRLEMQFLRFDVESSSDCEYDYLSINGEKICGLIENTTRTYLFQDYEKTLTFHSDSGTSRPGFMIRVQQVDCSVATTEPPLPPSKPCDQHFSTSTFEVRSDNHPDNYDPHLRCTYTVSRAHPGVCALELTFLTFDVEASDGCQYDYLKVQEEKLCGIYPSNLKRIIPFEDSEVTLEFHSDGATSRPGFHIRGQQMDCAPLTDQVTLPAVAGGCDLTFNNGSGTIQSPGFPEPYPSSRRCVYRFMALPEHCRITFQFLEFALHAENALCERDFLRINGIKYCGPQLLGQKRTVTFYGYPREVNVTFESDDQLSDKGFYAVYRQLPCSPALGRSPSQRTDSKPRSCDRLYASLAFSILSPDHPENYPADVNCRYTIRRLGPKICKLKLSFRQFDVESSEGCEYDYLEVDGTKICGTLPPNEIRMVEFKDYQTIFTFHSDSANSKSGFVIKVEQEECQDTPPPLPPKPPKVQPPKFEPHHHFEPPVAEPPLIEEPYIYPQPHFEYEHLVDYPIYEASSLQRNLQMATQNCDRTFKRPEFEIRSVNFPLPYPNGLNCRYLVQKASEDICWVKLVFLRFDLEPSDDCHFDYLSINGKRICGTLQDDEIRAYLFNSDEISMYFRSDGANAHRGFLIRGEQLKCKTKEAPPTAIKVPSSCDRMYDRDLFVLQSPNFPDPYPPETDCTFTIKKANRYICGLQLTMLAFDVENEASCSRDSLQIEGDKLCGPIPTRTIRNVPFAGETVIMKFKSDVKNERPGFSILVQQLEDCEDIRRSASSAGDCSHEYSAETFLLQSPRFPEEYLADSSCEYRIRRHSPSHCRLELRILSFDVEEGTDGRCDADCLELPAGYTLCGQLPKDHTENLYFTGKDIVLKFRSDSTTQRPGFSIQVRQAMDCGSTTPVATPEAPKCGGVYDSEEFSLKSPGFPNDYPNNSQCEYLVKKISPDICGLELKFAHFDVEKGPDCSYDYLDIGHKTICGQLPAGFTRMIPFENLEMKFTFHSDKGTSRSGFAIKIRQRSDCGTTWKPVTPPTRMCDHCLKENRGHLISPDYPMNYPSGLKCTYHLQRAKTYCGLEIFFHDFQLQETPSCSGDALIVEGEEEERLCGSVLKGKIRKIDFPIGDENEITLRFETDDQGSAPGFHAEYRQIPCRGYPWRQGRSQWTPSNGSDWNRSN
ncbi:cubilin-like isoform X1 [Argiope bruennichi]|uniref:cubilin-like isoform X1 n=1 Tax=Argiope bruennichi TaxID=94029 RepID=UPI0024957549|nr:cubilin-like isoform X1 [Argiope bruennichi]